MDIALTINDEQLTALVDAIVARISFHGQSARAIQGEPARLAYSEDEAAALLGLKKHVLRDERLRGHIAACRIVRGRIRYTTEDLTTYLLERRMPRES